MNMNRAFFERNERVKPQWRVVDATDKVIGRLATEIADALSGKDKATYTPHALCGDYVVVINASKARFTGEKMDKKEYVWYTGWMGGQKKLTAAQMQARHPKFIIEHAVKGMLRKNRLARKQLKRLKIYVGAQHPHAAQVATK